MTLDELKQEANKLGYRVVKKPPYDCHCYMPYPNKNCKQKNGKWKCVDIYTPIKEVKRGDFLAVTHCARIGGDLCN